MLDLVSFLGVLIIFYIICSDNKKLNSKINHKYYFSGVSKRTPWDNKYL